MKSLLIIIFFLSALLSLQAQEKWPAFVNQQKPTLDQQNYQFLYNYFNHDDVKTQKYWAEHVKGMKMVVFIDLTNQRLDVLDMREVFKIALTDSISSGMKAHPTPTGNWKICNKKDVLFSVTWKCNMTHWQALEPGESFGVHGLEGHTYEKQLGKAVSHGCIRLRKSIEVKFYELVPIGTRVAISGRPPWESYNKK